MVARRPFRGRSRPALATKTKNGYTFIKCSRFNQVSTLKCEISTEQFKVFEIFNANTVDGTYTHFYGINTLS